MDITNPEAKNFMLEIYSMTDGNTDAQVSMYDVGDLLGMEKEEASALAQDLIIDELLELKTLSGGIGITNKGLEALQVGVSGSGASSLGKLGNEQTVTAQDIDILNSLMKIIKDGLSSENRSYEHFEEIAIDLKTIEVQLLSPKPATSIIREILRRMADRLTAFEYQDLGKEVLSVAD